MAVAAVSHTLRDAVFEWEGTNREGNPVRGQIRAMGENHAMAVLRRQGLQPLKVSLQRRTSDRAGRAIKPSDITSFTRQLASMMKAGVPLLQGFEVVSRGHSNPRMVRLLNDIRSDIETGTSLSPAFGKHPAQFNSLYCNLVAAGEAAGILDALLDRLAIYMEKTEAMKAKVKSALTYPAAVLAVALAVIAIIMIVVIPAFESVFSSFGADLPAPTLFVMGVSEFFVAYWWIMLAAGGVGTAVFLWQLRRSEPLQTWRDRVVLKLPVFGGLLEKACIARWTRTLSTMFAAGVPLMDALELAGGTTGNSVYERATFKIQQEVSTGVSLNAAMANSGVFPNMVVQMAAIGEESGSLDHMLGKAADFFEAEVDQKVGALASLMEPFIIVVLGSLIGGIVVSMYLPIFELGQVI
jgi:type IV pilus assembly protein PilC